MAEVDILLAAYNGERFIAEQIDSILSQTFKEIRIVIRDDGSSDNTPEIIEQYAKKYPSMIEVVHDDAVCKSPTKNFFQLMKYATANYVMFSDQDDYWLPYKVQITFDYMKRIELANPGKPVCVFAGMEVVDAKLNSLDDFSALEIKQGRYKDFTNLMIKNIASGCTEMINKTLYENIGEYSEFVLVHDWWLATYACACGIICHVPMALMYYRQHEHNAIGTDSSPYRKHAGGGY